MKYILMDLDGTLSDSMLGITKSVQYALKECNVIEDNLDNLCKYIGPPLRASLRQYNGFNEEQVEFALVKYREYFEKYGIYENKVYDGMEELLGKLKKAGKILIVATSKPEEYSRKIIGLCGLKDYFTDVCGATMDNKRAAKKEVIQYALDKNGVKDLSSVVMIGDRWYDIEGAKNVGIASIGVLYGFGNRKELLDIGADRIAETVKDIYDIVMSM